MEEKKSTEEICERAKVLYGEKKFAEAVELFESVEKDADAESLFALGVCYNYNLGVSEPDEEKRGATASKYFIRAAEMGHTDAQCFAALCYLHGIGVEENATAP